MCVLGFIAFAKEGGVAWFTNKPRRGGGGVKGERRQRELERGKKAPRVSAFVVGYLPMKG